jgi:phosphohistidine phosphatase SixA
MPPVRPVKDPSRLVPASGRAALFGLAVLLLLTTASALAQLDPKERSSLPAQQWPPDRLVAELRKGGYVLYFRHTSTDFSQNDKRMKDYDDCANQRNLTDKGRAEARAVGAAVRVLGLAFERVLASPFCRTVETAQLVFGRAEKMQEVRGGPAAPANPERYASLRKILATPVRPGANLAVVSHGNPFVNLAGPPYLAEGEAAVIRAIPDDFQIMARIRVEDWDGLKEAPTRR